MCMLDPVMNLAGGRAAPASRAFSVQAGLFSVGSFVATDALGHQTQAVLPAASSASQRVAAHRAAGAVGGAQVRDALRGV